MTENVIWSLSECDSPLEHLDQIKALFHRLDWTNLSIDLAKCDFVKAKITYLVKIVGQGQVQPVEAKASAIQGDPLYPFFNELE